MEIIANCIDLKPNEHVLIPSYEYPTTSICFLKRSKIKIFRFRSKNFMIDKNDLLKKYQKKPKPLFLCIMLVIVMILNFI